MMVGEKIKMYRLEKGMNMSELAERAGVAKSYLSTIERDIQKNPSVQFLEKVAPVLDTDIYSLLGIDSSNSSSGEELDEEWKELVGEAMNSGISKEEFSNFLEFSRWKMSQG